MGISASRQDRSTQRVVKKAVKCGRTQSLAQVLQDPHAMASMKGFLSNALHSAARKGNSGAITVILNSLEWACQQNVHPDDLLIATRCLIDEYDHHHMTPLLLACMEGHAECVKELLAHGADPLATNRAGTNSLQMAAREGHVACLGHLLSAATLSRFPSFVDEQNTCGYTALHFAVWHQREGAAQALLDAGASLTIRNFMQGYDGIGAGSGKTPLHLAAWVGNTSMVKILLRAHLERISDDNRTPDPRLLRSSDGHVPYEMVSPLCHQMQELRHILSPTTDWEEIFGAELHSFYLLPPEQRQAAALRSQLLDQVTQAQQSCQDTAHTCCSMPESPPKTIQGRSHNMHASCSQGSLSSSCSSHCSSDGGYMRLSSQLVGSPASSSRHLMTSKTGLVGNALRQPVSAGFAGNDLGCSPHSPDSMFIGQAFPWSGCEPGCEEVCDCDACMGLSEEDVQEAEEHDMQCGICLEEVETRVLMNSCNHSLCVDCMKGMLEALKAGVPPTCPFCRQNISSLRLA